MRTSPSLKACPALAGERAYLEARAVSSRAPAPRGALEGLDRVLELVRFEERLGAGERSLDARALGRSRRRGEEAGVDVEPRGEPLDRLVRRARLAALDLADVLLGEAIAGEVGLRQTGGDAKRRRRRASAAPGCGGGGGGAAVASVSRSSDRSEAEVGWRGPPSRSGHIGNSGLNRTTVGEANVSRIHLTELLDFSEPLLQ